MHSVQKGICDRCGCAFLLDQLKTERGGKKTCSGPGTNRCFEPRHPQEFVTSVRPDRNPTAYRVVTQMTFLSANAVSADDL